MAGLRIPAQTFFSFLHITDEDFQTIRFALGLCSDLCRCCGFVSPNMRSFVEFVRRQAPVVYVGSVKEVRVLQRTKFNIKAKAVVDVKEETRTPGRDSQQATIEYSSYDEKTPLLEGGPQYQLRTGVMVLIFANSFDAPIPPGYLLQGSHQELLQRVEALRESLSKMSAAD